MRFNSGCFVVALTTLAAAQDVSLETVKRVFAEALVPGNLSLPFNPKALLEVTFSQPTGRPITLHAGIRRPRNATVGPPTFGVVGSVGNGPFVVAAVDLDVPTPQTRTAAQVRHFLGGNFVREQRASAHLTNNTPPLTEYHQPKPPAGSDPHRYVFLLFEQSKAFDTQTLVNSTSSVYSFNISQFAGAVGLGQPIGGMFMLVGPDPPASV